MLNVPYEEARTAI